MKNYFRYAMVLLDCLAIGWVIKPSDNIELFIGIICAVHLALTEICTLLDHRKGYK